MKSSYLLAGITSGMLVKFTRKNRFSFRPKYISRFLFLLQNGIWASFFKFKDRFHRGKQIKAHPVPDDPIIIIGHWRTGSTFLHQLMNLDENLAAPTLFQASQPFGFLYAYRYYKPVMKVVLGKHRPFDQMKTGMDEPQEDEFALYRMNGCSPLNRLVFPTSKEYFLNGMPDFIPPEELREKWIEDMKYFYQKVSWKTGKRLVLKNPFHSMRVELLAEIFPKAKFIHIYRNPLSVVPSTVRMWSIVGSQNCLNRNWKNPSFHEVSAVMAQMLETVKSSLAGLPADRFYEIRYEHLEKDTISELKRMYDYLGLKYTKEFDTRAVTFLEETKNFEKGTYTISPEEKIAICTHLKNQMEYFGYNTESAIEHITEPTQVLI